MDIADPAVPFGKIAASFTPPIWRSAIRLLFHFAFYARSTSTEGFFADPEIGREALQLAGIHAVGITNNVNYGGNIVASIALGPSSAFCIPARGPISPPPARPHIVVRKARVGLSSAAPSVGRQSWGARGCTWHCRAQPRRYHVPRAHHPAFRWRTGPACRRDRHLGGCGSSDHSQ